ncbi:hypothetical protein [Prosthecobacter sp.]|uniref:hypothetical protein n=1 Tax=Prosthecobacter sp. TaxID=1965333 RepID=UPI0037841E75
MPGERGLHAKSGVVRDAAAGGRVLGYPPALGKQETRRWIAVSKMPDALRRLKTLEKPMNGSKEA